MTSSPKIYHYLVSGYRTPLFEVSWPELEYVPQGFEPQASDTIGTGHSGEICYLTSLQSDYLKTKVDTLAQLNQLGSRGKETSRTKIKSTEFTN